jgi:hypothetical protein
MDIPKRLDINCSCDRMWNADLLAGGRRLSVKLNGEELQRVVAYDIPGRWAERHKMADGKLVIEGTGNDRRVAIERVHGVITVEIEPRTPDEFKE